MYLEQMRKSEIAYYHVSPPSSRELILVGLTSVPRNNDFHFLYLHVTVCVEDAIRCVCMYSSYIHITNQVIRERDVAYLYLYDKWHKCIIPLSYVAAPPHFSVGFTRCLYADAELPAAAPASY